MNRFQQIFSFHYLLSFLLYFWRYYKKLTGIFNSGNILVTEILFGLQTISTNMEAFKQTSKYAIINRRTELRLSENSEVVIPKEKNDETSIVVEAGTLIQLHDLRKVQESKSSRKNFIPVQVKDFSCDTWNPMYENLYECDSNYFQMVTEQLWPYVISISNGDKRLKLVKRERDDKWIVYLKQNDVVTVPGEIFGMKQKKFDCIIRYIGPVTELSSHGYYFGLELLDLNSGYSPQTNDIPFSLKYFNCDPNISLIVTADCIKKISNELIKNIETVGISDYIAKFRNALGFDVNGQYNSLKRSKTKLASKKEPTAQFYADNLLNSRSELDASTSNSGNMNRSEEAKAKSRTKNAYEKNDYIKSIQKHDKSIESQYAASSHTQPAGILKNSGLVSSTAKAHSSKYNQEPELIVINNDDIKESTKNESNMIILEKKETGEMDLVNILGGNWPNNAGEAGKILNKVDYTKAPYPIPQHSASKTNSSKETIQPKMTRSERNKSPNLLSHFGSTKYNTCNKDVPMATQSEPSVSVLSTNLKEPNLPNYDNLTNASPNGFSSVNDDDIPDFELINDNTLQELVGTDLGIGSVVEVNPPEATKSLYGVIRWIGQPPGETNLMVGVELEEEQHNPQLFTTDGSFYDNRLFKCQKNRALFVEPKYCTHDRRFADVEGASGMNGTGGAGKVVNGSLKATTTTATTDSKMFGQIECPSVPGAVAPLKISNLEDLEKNCGKFKGIQGHHNSCYLDATLFSMFMFSTVFDSLLFRPPDGEDIPQYTTVQKVLREEIVNPLRKNVFVRADRVMKLRKLLDRLSSVSGLTSEEKDPEEFLNSLLAQIMKAEPFLKLSSGQDAYFYQLFVEKDERLSFPSVQQLFEQSFHSSDIKLKEIPSCLIIQMPRFGKNYKMYQRILPSQVLDVTDIIEDSPRQCSICGKLAEFECRQCFGMLQTDSSLESTAFCGACVQTIHSHHQRQNHNYKKLSVPEDFLMMMHKTNLSAPRLYMELFAVVCIETSHYVAFVKAGSGPDAPWCFFDSMADRKGEINGYNIPEMITVPDLPLWLSEEGSRTLNESSTNDKLLPEHAKRLFCDSYMCMYQSDVMMYR